jgi:hypothetical protein
MELDRGRVRGLPSSPMASSRSRARTVSSRPDGPRSPMTPAHAEDAGGAPRAEGLFLDAPPDRGLRVVGALMNTWTDAADYLGDPSPAEASVETGTAVT